MFSLLWNTRLLFVVFKTFIFPMEYITADAGCRRPKGKGREMQEGEGKKGNGKGVGKSGCARKMRCMEDESVCEVRVVVVGAGCGEIANVLSDFFCLFVNGLFFVCEWIIM